MILGNHPVDLRLLEHDLGNQDAIRVACLSPGEVTAMPPIPVQQPALNRCEAVARVQLLPFLISGCTVSQTHVARIPANEQGREHRDDKKAGVDRERPWQVFA
jgi:hypothetical protein